MSSRELLQVLTPVGALPDAPATPPRRSGPDRRSSLRVTLGPGLPVELNDLGPARLKELGLGGAILQTKRKLRSEDRYLLQLDYQGSRASFQIEVYQSSLHELFYDDNLNSHVSFRSRVVCCDPSIDSLNLLYRIMRDYWAPCIGVGSTGDLPSIL